jgi:hypothetical protein
MAFSSSSTSAGGRFWRPMMLCERRGAASVEASQGGSSMCDEMGPECARMEAAVRQSQPRRKCQDSEERLRRPPWFNHGTLASEEVRTRPAHSLGQGVPLDRSTSGSPPSRSRQLQRGRDAVAGQHLGCLGAKRDPSGTPRGRQPLLLAAKTAAAQQTRDVAQRGQVCENRFGCWGSVGV